MIEIRKDWHPIFRLLYNLFQGWKGFMYYRNLKKNLLIRIGSCLDNEGKPWIYVSVTRDPWSEKRPRCSHSVEEVFLFYYSDGSFGTEQRVEFVSFLGWAKKNALGRTGTYSSEDYNRESWPWGKKQLDKLLELINSSARSDPYTGTFLSPEEAARQDEHFANMITAIDTWGHRLEKKLERQGTGIIEAPPLFGPESDEEGQSP